MRKGSCQGRELTIKERIILGVSGGVDSSASAMLLKKAGYEPVGVRLRLHDNENELDNSRVALLSDKLGIEIIDIDAREMFKREVIGSFLRSYEDMDTPNPCVLCNERVKFHMLFQQADKMGIDKVATGHYAGKGSYLGRSAITRAEDRRKDQSYMLYRLPCEWISRLVFPLEEFKKQDVREIVSDGLGGRHLGDGDSQDICFIPGELNDFLKENLKTGSDKPGPIIDLEGRVLGTHKGLYRYTIGQRKGLGLGGGPWFVIEKDRAGNRLILGRAEDGLVAKIGCNMVAWQHRVNLSCSYLIQHRYRSAPVEAVLTALSPDGAEITLNKPARGVAPGQSLVFYDDNVLLGGGIITKAEEV